MAGYYRRRDQALAPSELSTLGGQLLASPYLSVNNLNRDFVATRGFSIVFKQESLPVVVQRFGYLEPYLALALEADCNAFYLNALLLTQNSRVDPHIDRSLRSYCKTVDPPAAVSVLYIQVPPALEGGELVLCCGKKPVGQIRPVENTLVHVQGNLTHSVNKMRSPGRRLSLVCEQYQLSELELLSIPTFTVESRVQPVR